MASGLNYVLYGLLVAGALAFSRFEMRSWGTARTPFAFIVYPFLAVLTLAVFVAPHLGFFPLHARTLVVFGFYFALLAAASGIYRNLATEGATAPGPPSPPPGEGPSIGTLEYGFLCVLLVALFAGDLLGGGDAAPLEKGELAVGGLRGHVMEIGVAYLVIALSQGGGARAARALFVGLILWVLTVNQVKYPILIPLAGSALYRWASGRLATWKLAVAGAMVPLLIVASVYGFLGAGAPELDAASSPQIAEFVVEHTLGYVLAGVLGFDQLLAHLRIPWLDLDGVTYVLAPFVNLGRLLVSSLHYFNPVNSQYFDIHTNGTIDSNVFTLFGSLAFRGGWVLASFTTIAFGAVTYWIWARWWLTVGALASAAGTYWIATAMLSWFDPYFPSLSTIEIVGFLWLRAAVAGAETPFRVATHSPPEPTDPGSS